MPDLNEGINVDDILQFKELAKQDPAKADRSPTLIAHWDGGDRSRVEFGDIVTHVGGDNDLGPMHMVLASLAACDVDLVAMHASILGLKIESLSVEVTGQFNVRAYLGLEDAPGSGYGAITNRVRIHVPGATPEQIAFLRERCQKSSPVGDSLARPIEMKLGFEADTGG
ncbi:MAG: OsmC family protein [Candidatus Marinimicrobia bacterium]|nr:OsmC family protein [Candidatus Neomarinimicrobiota bacterium]